MSIRNPINHLLLLAKAHLATANIAFWTFLNIPVLISTLLSFAFGVYYSLDNFDERFFMSNIKKHCLLSSLYGVGYMFCSGAIMQTFLLSIGFSEENVYLLNSLMQAAQVVMMCVMTFVSGKIKRVKLFSSISYLSLVVLAVVFLLGAINPGIMGNAYVIAVFIASGISYTGVGLYSIIMYCLPYYTINMKDYGKMTGISVALSGAVSFVISFIHSFVVSKIDYAFAMIWFFILTIACLVLCFFVCSSLREIEGGAQAPKTTKADMIAVFKNKDTYILLLPNFARGLAAGIMSVIAVIGISRGLLTEQTSSYVNIIMQITMFAANIFYVNAYKKISTTTLLLVSGIGVAAFIPFCLGGGSVLFLVMFLFAYFFRMICDTAIPVVITEIIPPSQIGAYTSIRMLVFTGAQAVATLIITGLTALIGYTGLMIFAAVMQLICCVPYYAVAIREKRRKNSLDL